MMCFGVYLLMSDLLNDCMTNSVKFCSIIEGTAYPESFFCTATVINMIEKLVLLEVLGSKNALY
jgi:hypothetical protein